VLGAVWGEPGTAVAGRGGSPEAPTRHSRVVLQRYAFDPVPPSIVTLFGGDARAWTYGVDVWSDLGADRVMLQASPVFGSFEDAHRRYATMKDRLVRAVGAPETIVEHNGAGAWEGAEFFRCVRYEPWLAPIEPRGGGCWWGATWATETSWLTLLIVSAGDAAGRVIAYERPYRVLPDGRDDRPRRDASR